MKRLRFGNRLTLYLLLACTLLAVILAVESSLTRQWQIDALLEEPPVTADVINISRSEYTPPTIRAFDEILKRPLFSETREPPTPPEKVAANLAPVVEHIRLELEGVALTPEARTAVLRDLTTKKMLRLEEGASHNGWKLESVQTDSALFKRNQQTVELELVVEERKLGKKAGTRLGKETGKTNAAGKQ
jgi:hypothetical protein